MLFKYWKITCRVSFLWVVFFMPLASLNATSLGKPIVSAQETLLHADLVLEGTVKEVFFKYKNNDSKCFVYTYVLVVDKIFKGDVSIGDKIYVGQNIYSGSVSVKQKKIVILYSITRDFVETCGQSQYSYGIPLPEAKIFPGLAIGLYDVFGASGEKYKVTNCSKSKEFLFDEEKSSNAISVENSINDLGLECRTVTGRYDDLRSNIENALR